MTIPYVIVKFKCLALQRRRKSALPHPSLYLVLLCEKQPCAVSGVYLWEVSGIQHELSCCNCKPSRESLSSPCNINMLLRLSLCAVFRVARGVCACFAFKELFPSEGYLQDCNISLQTQTGTLWRDICGVRAGGSEAWKTLSSIPKTPSCF